MTSEDGREDAPDADADLDAHVEAVCPHELASLPIEGHAYSVTVSDSLVVVAAREGGVRMIDVADPGTPTELGNYYGGQATHSVVETNTLFVAHWEHDLTLYNITNPAAPRPMSAFDTGGHVWWVAVDRGKAYVADSITGIHVLDVSGTPAISELSSIDVDGEELAVEVIDSTHFAVAAGAGGLHIVDWSNPAAPVELGSLPTADYAKALVVAGRRVFVADSFGGLRIVAVDDFAHPVELAVVTAPDVAALDVALSGPLVAVASGTAGVQFIDVSEAAAPVPLAIFDTTAVPGRSANGVALAGSLAYVAVSDDTASSLFVLSLDCE